jgi:MarR family transcriptional regulator, lower aerobic nicotinate degradation pathway regulator
MSLQSLYSKPGHLIRRLQQIAVAIFVEETAEFGLTPVQYAALIAIREHPDIDVTRLSALIAFDRSTLGNVVKRLQQKRWLIRRPDRIDKRIKLLRITPAGRGLLIKIEPAVARAQRRMLAPLPKSERKRFAEQLTQLVEINNIHSRAPMRHSQRQRKNGAANGQLKFFSSNPVPP